MAGAVKEITQTAQKTANTFREALQDILVPEMRAVKASIEALTQEMRLRNENVTQELRLRTDQLQEELRTRTDQLQEEMRTRFSQIQEELRMRDANVKEEARARETRQDAAIKNLSDKIDFAIDIRERLVQLEARMPRTQ